MIILGRDSKVTLIHLAKRDPDREVLHSEEFVGAVTFEDFRKNYVGTMFHGKVIYPTVDETGSAKIVKGFKINRIVIGERNHFVFQAITEDNSIITFIPRDYDVKKNYSYDEEIKCYERMWDQIQMVYRNVACLADKSAEWAKDRDEAYGTVFRHRD